MGEAPGDTALGESDEGAVTTDAALLTTPPPEPVRKALGMRVIIAYKLLKAPLMFTLAALLTFAPHLTQEWVRELAVSLSAGGWLLSRIGRWLAAHGVDGLQGAKLLAWADGATTTLEAVLLIFDKPWGEWMVVMGVGAFVPLEVRSILRHPSWVKLAVLVINALIVTYLVRRRLQAARAHAAAVRPSTQVSET